ncbi:MAG: hypothetical protein ACR2PZ_13130 [Pseudomonadales bacterium]
MPIAARRVKLIYVAELQAFFLGAPDIGGSGMKEVRVVVGAIPTSFQK